MRKFLSGLLIFIFIVGVVLVIGYYYFIRAMGRNFVHEPLPERLSNEAPAESMPNRIHFPVKLSGIAFDSALTKFLVKHPAYQIPDTLQFEGPVECGCDCPGIIKKFYFSKEPSEIYEITFNYGDIEDGIIDVVFMFKNGKWICSKSAKLDSTEKSRIQVRFSQEVLEKLN